MNNAISRLLEAATADLPSWFVELSPEAREKYLSMHPESSLHGKGVSEDGELKQSKDREKSDEDRSKDSGSKEEKKGTDIVPHGEKRGSDGKFESKDSSEKKPGTDVARKGKHKDDDVIDVDFKEVPREPKEKKKLPAPEKKDEKKENKQTHSEEKKKLEKKSETERKEPPKKEAPARPKKDDKDAAPKKPKAPSAIERIKSDEDEERKNRAEERREEKHQHQMEVMRRKEEERQADRAEKKAKEGKKDNTTPDADKRPTDHNKTTEQKKPDTHKHDKKHPEKKDDKKTDKKDHSNEMESPKSSDSESDVSRSEPSAEKHNPNSMPNPNGEPNPHGKSGGEGGGSRESRPSPVTPKGSPSKPAEPVKPQGAPSLPDDTDVNFEDAPNPGKPTEPRNPEPEGSGSGSDSGTLESKSPSAPNSTHPNNRGGGAPKSEAPKVEEKEGRESEKVETPETPKGEGETPAQPKEDGKDSAPAPEANEPVEPNVGEGVPEVSEQTPNESEPAPEGDQPDSADISPFDQSQPETPSEPNLPENRNPESGEAPALNQDNTPVGQEHKVEKGDEPRAESPDRDDSDQKSPGFSAPPAGADSMQKPDAGSSPTKSPEVGEGNVPKGESIEQKHVESPNDPFQTRAPRDLGERHLGLTPEKNSEQDQQKDGLPTAPNSPARTKSAESVRAQAQNIAQRLMRGSASVPKGLAAMYNIMAGRGTAQDGHAALALMNSILSAAAAGAGGPLGFATFSAIKHAGIPAMVAIVKKAFGESMPTANPEHQQEDLTRLVKSAADYAQSGSIPAQAWHEGVKEARQQGG